MLSHAMVAALGASLLAFAPVVAAQQAPAREFALASQPLGDALNRLAQAANVQIMVPPDLVRGRTAPALTGRYTVQQALDRLLAGTGLVHRSTRSGVITVARADAPARPAPPAPPPTAPAPQAQQEAPEVRDMSSVQVTGSRIKRAEVEGPSPVTVISAQQIEAEGHATVFDALESMVMASGQVETELSGGFSANAHPLNLRGLGPGRSLLLIDGRRAADYPFPYGGNSNFQNFGNIPSGAVERIEILAGGASAIYGADAVSGVVNVVLKRGYDGDEVKLRAGTSTMGGRDRVDLQWTGGKTGEQWGLTYAFQYYNQEILYGTQRDHWDPRRDPLADPRTGVIADPGLRMRLGADSSSRPLWQFPAGTCEQWGGDFHDTPYLRISGGRVQNMGNYCGYWGDARNQSLSKGKNELAGYLFGTWTFSPELEGWASLQAWHSKATSHGGFESITGPHTDGVGRIGAFYDPQFSTVVGIDRYLTPFELGGISAMDQHYKEYSVDIAAGLRGRLERFDWDLTLSHAEYYFQRDRRRLIGNRVNDWFFGQQLGTRPNGDPIYRMNLDHWLRPMTAAEYASLSTIAHYEAESWVDTASFVMTGDLFELPAGPVGSAVVLEASRQGYDMESDPRALPGVTQLYNLTTTNGRGDRDRYAAGIEFSIPILSTLKASLAGRYDKYDDITNLDDAKTWNAGLEWRPLDSLLIRGSYATSFKAPDMH
ncbi:MAG: TonB-dependent receptor, partial [Luteimonas sp.]|nr:TonB-dependent receptor [Luteimonas sp.]